MSNRTFLETIRSLFFREEHVCPWWLAYTFDNPLRRFLHDPSAILSPYVKTGMTVADIGCGMGYFSVAMGHMVGTTGKVLAVDIQEKMLQKTRKRAGKKGLAGTVHPVLARQDDIGIQKPVDFVLTFWMVHETGDIPRFLKQVYSALKHQGKLLVAEPKMHVSNKKFESILSQAQIAGFTLIDSPKIGMSRTALLLKS